jgi:DNA-directed RNA polymerase sigma subunit (sigma70/sigma32)
MLDLIQAGNEGLLLAVSSFIGESSDNFSAYAASGIESALSKAVSESQSPRDLSGRSMQRRVFSACWTVF